MSPAYDLKNKIKSRLKQFVNPHLPAAGNQHAAVISIASSKGGVGKTTSAVNLAAALARKCKVKTLLVDLDPQGHVSCSMPWQWPLEETISDVLLQKGRDLIEITKPYKEIENLYLTPSDKNLTETESILSAKLGKEFILENAIKLAKSHFDVILIDCPPNLGTLTLNAMVASDYIITPCDMSVLAFEGVSDLMNTIELVEERLHHTPQVLGVLVTRFDRRTKKTNQEVLEGLQSLYGNLLFDPPIPLSSVINRAHLAGKDILAFAPNSPGAHAYTKIAQKIHKRIRLTSKQSQTKSHNIKTTVHMQA